MEMNRFDRNIELFGETGQERLRRSKVAVVGIGGLGTHILQQLALLGVGGLIVVDGEDLSQSNKNRYIGVRHDDPAPGSRKVDLAERMVATIDPSIQVRKIPTSFLTEEAFSAIRASDAVFGCLDNEGGRLILTELCSAYARPYLDLATDVLQGPPLQYGGRVVTSWDGDGCPVCLGALDLAEAHRDLAAPAVKRDLEAIYGVERQHLGAAGPAVVTLNGVVASLATTEFMVAMTGLRLPAKLLQYYGHRGVVTLSKDAPHAACYYCKGVWGAGDKAGVARYIDRGPAAA
jgi:hypothetical protein